MFDPNYPGLIADPELVYAPLRDAAPVAHALIGHQSHWVLSRHADVVRILEGAQGLMRPPGVGTPEIYGDGPAARLWRASLSMMDPPDHTRIRQLVGRAFTRRRAEALRPRVRVIVDEIFAGLEARDHLEIVRDLSLQLPMRVICELLGIERKDWEMLESWTPDVLKIFLPNANSAADLERLHRASQNFLDYFDRLIEARRREPRDDVTSSLAELEVANGLTRDELVGAMRGLLTAGFETSAATISAAVLAFARQPEQLQLLQARPELVASAVEELLRWETPVQAQTRYLGAGLSLHGRELPRGSAMMLLLGAANRDPRRFANPERVDIALDCSDHVAFGGGRHFCLGAYLARVELQSVLETIALRWRRISVLDDPPMRRQHFQFRSIERMTAVVHWR